jgi:cardiolipin synthase (CMP-forming)
VPAIARRRSSSNIVRHLPNLICLVRLALIWPVATALYGGRYGLALALFMLAAVSDGLDGYLAKRFNWTSDLGKILDPAADKLLLVTVFIESTWLGLVPWWVTAAAVARDVLIALGALVFRLWFGPLRGRPTIISKINTGAQLLYLMAVMLGAAVAFPPRDVLQALALTVVATTTLSGIHYVQAFTRRAWALADKDGASGPRPA